PEKVTSIGEDAFAGCGLTTITIPSSVNSIGGAAFDYCNNLTSAKFENPTGWFVADSADATEGTSVTTLTADFSDVNANVLKGLGENEYMLRKDA
ncbi:MAG: leucine-rich repeat protein, partial [Clostridia bacterium]|nr:leucine-rich repeat protein [Clostridia bacterium]